ncbi:hypothetical protein SDRG_12681 [Saprolegnia diclina VS20]|uniref:J domain-containing protein n=1 Tax=Saprolegnia diclina (strain VS20) TaxID=1156394 RepID=T0Q881_SAPDV|nr:hypothetical protein SDRG_12681 [Saprolegnia diclina VS20]EQC29680.1 hypothetical protein SDRG_12681 [Saprolegnia diclina VS20]|eukprot:XP_008616984.1 hypothetical protein SDRG_12681 [Saprolegnia diclina VS20]
MAETWAFYYLQAEDGEDRSHPNAFRIPKSGELTLGDVHAHFPLGSPAGFHFRFRLNHGETFYWIDVTAPTATVPLVNGRVICKVLRHVRPTKKGLVLQRKPVYSMATDAAKPRDAKRPTKYSDEPKPSARPASAPPKQEVKPKESSESFEDFLAGAPKPAPAAPVDLMGGGSTWTAPKAAPKAAPVRRPSPPPVAASAPPKDFNDDCNQTVGPVSLADMAKHEVSADGTNVYNPDLVDKSTKSADVREAMEQREQQKAADIERARLELLARDQAKTQLEAAKANAVGALGPKLKNWAEDNGRKKNIRTLISTMHQILWPDAKWTEVNMGKLLTPNDVKKQYRRAIMVVHPDKAGGRTAEQLVIAERIFDAVNSAWDEFARTEMK